MDAFDLLEDLNIKRKCMFLVLSVETQSRLLFMFFWDLTQKLNFGS